MKQYVQSNKGTALGLNRKKNHKLIAIFTNGNKKKEIIVITKVIP